MIAAIGKFDALHRGHRALVEAARALGEPALVSFSGMAEVLGWEPRLPLIAAEDRSEVLAAWRTKEVIIPFADIRGLDGPGFLRRLRKEGCSGLVVGEDFRFGRDRAWSAKDLPELAQSEDMSLRIVPAVADAGGVVSSTRVREALDRGQVDVIQRLLDRPYRLRGTVVRGDGRGRRIGIPTANLAWVNQPVGGGVYAAWAWLDGRRLAAAVNAGSVPTAGAGRSFTVEAHLLDWSGDIYGASLALDLLQRLREERRFPDLEALVAQIRADIAATREVCRP